MKEVVIVSGARTAIGAFGGALKKVSAVELGSIVMREALRRANLRPVVNAQMKAGIPEKLMDQGTIELEKNELNAKGVDLFLKKPFRMKDLDQVVFQAKALYEEGRINLG